MKFYHSPGSCSEGILLLLKACGAQYEMVSTDLKKGAHCEAGYLALNPKGKVPALMLPDGSILTEWPVIAYWIAKTYPDARLLPTNLTEEVHVMALTEHIVSTLHMRGSVFAMLPQKFVTKPEDQEELRLHGQDVVRTGFARLAEQLGSKEYLFGAFSIVDAAAYYLILWRDRIGVELPEVLADYYRRIQLRLADNAL